MKRKRSYQYPEKYLLNKLKEATAILGHCVSRREINKLKNFPSGSVYEQRFGSWKKAIHKVGLLPRKGGFAPGTIEAKNHGQKIIAVKKKRGIIFKAYTHSRIAPLSMRFRIFKRDNFTCQYCGRTIKDNVKLVIDHKIPYSKGGPTSEDNLITCCFECNIGKLDILINLNTFKNKKPVK